MKHSLTFFIFLLLTQTLAYSQIIITTTGEDYFQNASVNFKVLDKENNEPIPYASVCLRPHGDTLITQFTLSSDEGKVKMKNVPKGYYDLSIELLGYAPFQKEYNISSPNSIPKVIYMSVDAKSLKGASITALGKAVEYLKDTVIYNASAFHVGTNAMLEDLLKKMPGMQVKDGQVTVGGKPISEITVNGRTFFFGDQSMALKNLPARIVERIKVIDKENEEVGQRSAMTDKKVMDVELKEEYSQGTFGNLALGGGAGWEDKLEKEDVKGLYNAKVVLCSYNDKDQLTAVAQGDNQTAGKGHNEKVAMNFNTSRVKNFNTTFSVIAQNSRGDVKGLGYSDYFATKTDKFGRQTASETQNKGKSLNATLDLELNKPSNCTFQFIPTVQIYGDRDWSDYDVTAPNYHYLFSSKGKTTSVAPSWTLYSTIKKLGKAGRTLSLSFIGSYDDQKLRSDEENTLLSGVGEYRNLRYRTAGGGLKNRFSLYYYEPITERLRAALIVKGIFNSDRSDRTAFNLPTLTVNKAYMAYSKVNDKYFSESLGLSYRGEKVQYDLGAKLGQSNRSNVTDYGDGRITTGAHDWSNVVSPYVSVHLDYNKQLYFDVQAVPLDAREVSPALFYNGATDMSIGNIYLRQPRNYEGLLTYGYYKKGTHPSVLNFTLIGGLKKYSVVYSNWFDAEGIRYSLPVNTKRPSVSLDLNFDFYRYFGSNDAWCFNLYAKAAYNTSVGYQSLTVRKSLDVNSFDYASFIGEIYGDATGNEFYSGRSGFSPSRTRILDLFSYAYIYHRTKTLSNTVGAYPKYYASFYSLNSAANQGVLALPIKWDIDYTFPFGLYVSNSLAARMYDGYGQGFDKWVWDWEVSMSKDVGRFTLSLKCKDILNQTVSLSHYANAEYYTNSIASMIGRSITLGLTFNFGKNNEAAQAGANRFIDKL